MEQASAPQQLEGSANEVASVSLPAHDVCRDGSHPPIDSFASPWVICVVCTRSEIFHPPLDCQESVSFEKERIPDMNTTQRQDVRLPLKIVIVTMNSLLVLQFLLGMIVNLFYALPFDTIVGKSGSFAEKMGVAFAYARTSTILALQLHWLNACLLILTSIALIILGVKAHQKMVWILAVALSLIFTIATVSGAAFIASAGSNYYSFSMATAFLIAYILAIFLLFSLFSQKKMKTQREKEPQESVIERSSKETANR
jgi:hypothetical protein